MTYPLTDILLACILAIAAGDEDADDLDHLRHDPAFERRVCARIEATRKGLDTRFVVTNMTTGSAETVYAVLYCARGQTENLIKLHKTQLASDRTSCRSPLAN